LPGRNNNGYPAVTIDYLDLRHLVARQWSMSDREAELLNNFLQLETIYAGAIDLSDTGIRKLQSLKHLTTLIGSG